MSSGVCFWDDDEDGVGRGLHAIHGITVCAARLPQVVVRSKEVNVEGVLGSRCEEGCEGLVEVDVGSSW